MKKTIGDTDTETPRTLLAFLPSLGLGGGIERYCNWMLDAVEEAGTRVVRVAFLERGDEPSLTRKLRFILRCTREARRARADSSVAVVICHPNLAFACLLAVRAAGLRTMSTRVLFYGTDIWPFGRISALLLRRSRSQVFTISSFSAGALAAIGISQVLAPGLRRDWYETLDQSPRTLRADQHNPLHILTVFRLDDAHAKGLPELLDALEQVRAGHDCLLTVAGSNALPPDLHDQVSNLSWVSVVVRPSDDELARLYVAADVFVLATRTRATRPSSGEGFGIVLVEAQLTGAPVVAPAFGGSDDAFLAGLTGVKPVDESAGALADVLKMLAADPTLVRQLGENAKVWARAAFDPDRCTREVQRLLLGYPASPLDAEVLLAEMEPATPSMPLDRSSTADSSASGGRSPEAVL